MMMLYPNERRRFHALQTPETVSPSRLSQPDRWNVLHAASAPAQARYATPGYTKRWQTASKSFLLHHPFCVRCRQQGRLTPATVVDHIIPHRGDQKLFWDESNWQALCKPCHDRKTWTEDRFVSYGYGSQP